MELSNVLSLREEIEKAIQSIEMTAQPAELYDPIKYILSLGGKRLRPVACLAVCEMFGGKARYALSQAIAIEVFHNFSLIHDDIMDQAPLRRGQKTVHEKWNPNIAILSGDAMMIQAYQHLQTNAGNKLPVLLRFFNATALKVCEGQQLDMNFEERDDVQLDEYLEMIRKKTAVLFGTALRIGAIMGGANVEEAQLIYDFGVDFGIAFQLQDDILDVFGTDKFGKQIGGDIIANKKAYPLLKALEIADDETKKELNDWLAIRNKDREKVAAVTAIFERLKIKDLAKAEMNRYYVSASLSLNSITLEPERKKVIREIAESMMSRDI